MRSAPTSWRHYRCRRADTAKNSTPPCEAATRNTPAFDRCRAIYKPVQCPDQEYFADGITDDLTTDLSRIADSFVIARNTAFTYKGKSVDAKEIGRELGVRYVLEGSVRRTGEQVRVNVQLIDTNSGAHIWADRFDTDRADLASGSAERDHWSPCPDAEY
jgi:hypothetical protein